MEVRSSLIGWLAAHPRYYAFLDHSEFPTWQSYLRVMARNFAWGDHMTLQAAAEQYRTDIIVVSSIPTIPDDRAVTELKPSGEYADVCTRLCFRSLRLLL